MKATSLLSPLSACLTLSILTCAQAPSVRRRGRSPEQRPAPPRSQRQPFEKLRLGMSEAESRSAAINSLRCAEQSQVGRPGENTAALPRPRQVVRSGALRHRWRQPARVKPWNSKSFPTSKPVACCGSALFRPKGVVVQRRAHETALARQARLRTKMHGKAWAELAPPRWPRASEPLALERLRPRPASSPAMPLCGCASCSFRPLCSLEHWKGIPFGRCQDPPSSSAELKVVVCSAAKGP